MSKWRARFHRDFHPLKVCDKAQHRLFTPLLVLSTATCSHYQNRSSRNQRAAALFYFLSSYAAAAIGFYISNMCDISCSHSKTLTSQQSAVVIHTTSQRSIIFLFIFNFFCFLLDPIESKHFKCSWASIMRPQHFWNMWFLLFEWYISQSSEIIAHSHIQLLFLAQLRIVHLLFVFPANPQNTECKHTGF